MNLIYVWKEDYLNKGNNVGVCLCSKYDIKYSIEKNEVIITNNRNYISEFWGEKIFDVIAIVGDNGAGKTMLLKNLMDVFECVNRGNIFDIEFFAIFEDKYPDSLKIIATDKSFNIKVYSEKKYKIKKEKVGNLSNDTLSLYKFGYFTNALSVNDYQMTTRSFYDASIGGLIRKFAKENVEMHYKSRDEDNIINYFSSQFYRIIEFIFMSDIDKFNIPFNLPKRIDICINRSYENIKYINYELKKMQNNKYRKLVTPKKFNFDRYIRSITEKYTNIWISELIRCLIINLFMELCIPKTSNQDKVEEAKNFIEILENYANNQKKTTIYKEIKEFINDVNNKCNDDYYCPKYIGFILWIEENEQFINNNCKGNYNCCSISLDKQNERFIMELLRHYKETSFAFPYFNFRLGLSSGELHFLNTFVNLYNMLEVEKAERAVVNRNSYKTFKCTNILLAFDELDLSLHPKWQRNYLYWLLGFIKSVFTMCEVHIIITTHSPIILSDFPQSNILYLEGNGQILKRDVKTFGNNIHSLFLDSFFLSSTGTVGAFVEHKINNIVYNLKNIKLSQDELDNILKTIYCVGDELVRNKLLLLYSKMTDMPLIEENKEESAEIIDMSIELLNMQKKQIEDTIRKLEQRKYDKDKN